MKTSSAKNKGRILQQYICKFLTELFVWGEGDAESRSMGSAGIDVMLSPEARADFPFSIESKNTKSFPSLAALNQAVYNVKTGTLPGVVWKPPGKGMNQSIIYFSFEEFSMFWKKENNDKTNK